MIERLSSSSHCKQQIIAIHCIYNLCGNWTSTKNTETPVSYWDRWEAKALAAGVSAHLAGLGRDLAQHSIGEVRGLGHEGDGDKMIAMALAAPITMELRFASDLRTPAGVSGRVDEEAYNVLAAKLGGADALDAALAGEKAAHDAAAGAVGTHRFFKGALGRMTQERIKA